MLLLTAPLLALLLAAPAPAGARAPSHAPDKAAQPPQDEAAKLRTELIGKLLTLATWCNDKELFLQRDNVWRSVLALESENAAARQGLRYARDAAGKWKDPAPREVKDRNAAALPEFSKKRSEVVGAWRDQLFALLDKEQADAARRAAALDEVLFVDPDDAFVHGLRGEARSGTNWVLQETVAGEARRAEIRASVQKARAAVPEAAKVPASAEDLALLPAWKTSLSADGMRALVQTGEAEAKEMLGTAHAGCALAEVLFGKPMPPNDGFTVYVLVDPGERDRLLAGIPGANDAQKKGWKDSAGFGIPASSSVVLWDKDAKRRLDCFARHVVASVLFKGFRIEAKDGWIFEGFGLYLAQQLSGTRMTWFIGTAAGEPSGLRTRLFSPKTDWFAEADRILKGSNPPKLAELLGKDLSAIKLEEMVVAQAFAAYLAEGLPKQLPEILARVGQGESSVAVLEAVTARPLPETEKRLVRWLGERH
jgi:predicted secreted protein